MNVLESPPDNVKDKGPIGLNLHKVSNFLTVRFSRNYLGLNQLLKLFYLRFLLLFTLDRMFSQIKHLACIGGFLYFLSSCAPQDTVLINPNCFSQLHRSLIKTTAKVVKTQVPHNKHSRYEIFDVLTTRDSLFYYGLDLNNLTLNIFEISKGFKESISINVPTLDKASGISVYSRDSIFVFRDMPVKLFLINQKGVLINQWDLGSAPVDWDLSNEYYLEDYQHMKPLLANGLLHLILSPLDYFYHNEKSRLKLFATYDLANKEWVKLYGGPKGVYLKNNIELPYEHGLPSRIIIGNYSYVSYPVDHYIYKYDYITGSLIDKLCASSRHIGKFSKIPDLGADMQQRLEFLITTAYYGKLNYHKDVKLVSRVVFHETPLFDVGGNMSDFCDRTISIMYFDEQMNFIEETEANPLDLNYFNEFMVALDNGFLLSPICESKYLSNYSDDGLALNLIKTLVYMNE